MSVDVLVADYLKKVERSNRMLVRVSTTWFQRGRAYVEQKSLTPLRRLSAPDFFFDEEVSAIGIHEAMQRITNFHEVRDGKYEIVFVNEHRDWETGAMDDYDYKLIPFTPIKK